MTEKSDQNKVKQIVLSSGTSFYWGMNLLKNEQRRAMFSIYSFCRMVDDIADSKLNKNLKLKRLKEWKKKIHDLYKKISDGFLERELKYSISKYKLKKIDFLDIIEGMEMDINKKIVYPSRKNLELYCDKVAGAVGCLSMDVFEIRTRDSRKYAKLLGRAFQLTNILRDIHEDSLIGRCYIPRELIRKYININTNPKVLIEESKFKSVCKDLIDETERYYFLAGEISKKFDQTKLKAPKLMKAMYKEIFKKICSENWNMRKRVRLSKIEKIKIILKNI